MIPDNIRLLGLPAYSPELNPVEHICDNLREKEFLNRVFDSIDSLEDHLEKALHDMENDRERIRSIVAWPWVINALMNWKWNNDKILAVLPGGVSGRQFTGHYRDQITPFMNGEKRYWWFSDKEIANHAKTAQTLAPR